MIKSENDSIGDVVAKILINHVQRVSIIMIAAIQISLSLDALKPYANYFDYLSILTEDLFSNDCFLQKFFNDIFKYPFYKILITLMLPIMIACVCFLIFSILILRKSLQNDKKSQEPANYLRKFIICFLVCSFLSYSMLLKCSFNLLNCIALTNDPLTKAQTFLNNSPNFQCWVGWHRYGAVPLGIGGIIIWGLFFPLFLWKIIKVNLKVTKIKIYSSLKNNGSMEKTNSIKKSNETPQGNDFRFFTKDYKKRFYYWESVVFIHKLFLNIFSQMSQWSNEQYLQMSNILFLLFYLSIVYKLQPFVIKKVNSLDCMSLITAFITNFSALILSSQNISIFVKYFLYFITILINGAFFIMGVYLVISYTKWKEMYLKTKSSILKMKHQITSFTGNKFSL